LEWPIPDTYSPTAISIAIMNKILVTGATGFLGNYVIQELLKHHCSVIATSSDRARAKKKKWYFDVEYISFDLGKMDRNTDYFKFFKKPDAVIHLAWEGLPNYKSSFHEEINLPRHENFLGNLIQNGLNDLAVTGTCLEYGMQEGELREDMSTIPTNSYAIAKNKLYKYLVSIQKAHSFSLKWIRLFYMFGEGQNPNSLLSQLDKALNEGLTSFNMSGGEQTRDYLPVEKVAEYIVKISLQKKVTGVINCSSGKPITIKSFVENYLKLKNKNIQLNLGYFPYPDYEPMHFWGDNSKLKSILENE
jgi:dTDP-6-deoxy-L-talose 4-dehydrogenase (NAD+)